MEGEAVTVGKIVRVCECDGFIDIVVGLDDVVGWDVVGSELGISEGV